MNRIPPIIHQVWVGKNPMPDQHRSWARGFISKHPNWEYKLWDDERLGDIGLHTDEIREWFWSEASMSNWIRLKMLWNYGGIYLDTDCECIKSLDPLREYAAFAAMQDEGRICNAVMGCEPFHPWIEWQIRHHPEGEPAHDAAWGVYTATEAPREGLTIIPQNWVYPFMYNAPEESRKSHEDSILIHHWAKSW